MARARVAGKAKPAYRDEPDVDKHSKVETYAALELEIDNWRWAGVPFFLRTGKHLSGRMTEIAIRFKQAPLSLFQDTPVSALRPNWLVIRIAPDEGISLQFEVKRRGPVVDLAPVKMEFKYDDWFEKQANVGYETLLYDVMIGDPALFMRADTVEHGWRIVQPVLDTWAKQTPRFANYASGSDGPQGRRRPDRQGQRPRVAADHRSVETAGMSSPTDIKLLLSDVDGTLVTKDKVPDRRLDSGSAGVAGSWDRPRPHLQPPAARYEDAGRALEPHHAPGRFQRRRLRRSAHPVDHRTPSCRSEGGGGRDGVPDQARFRRLGSIPKKTGSCSIPKTRTWSGRRSSCSFRQKWLAASTPC